MEEADPVEDNLYLTHQFSYSRFPIREYGMNYESQPLQTHEIREMEADPAIVERVIVSYRLMLDFYGMRLVSPETGLVDRALPPRNYAARYHNLVREYPTLFRTIIDPIIDRHPPLMARIIPQQSSYFPHFEMSIRNGAGTPQRWVLVAHFERTK
jgi:hypothetical protein